MTTRTYFRTETIHEVLTQSLGLRLLAYHFDILEDGQSSTADALYGASDQNIRVAQQMLRTDPDLQMMIACVGHPVQGVPRIDRLLIQTYNVMVHDDVPVVYSLHS